MTAEQPAEVCQPCWRTWCAYGALASAVGYCHHNRIAWRIRPSGEVQTTEATADEVKAMRAQLARAARGAS